MILERFDQLLVEGRAASRRAEGAVAHMAAGAAGDLAEFGRRQAAMVPAVEFPVGGEGDVIDVEIEAHADGVGRDDVVDVAVLKEIDLGVAGARRERAEHHRRAAALALDPFGDRVDLLGRKGDDGAARRQARDFLVAGETQAATGAGA